MVVNWLYATIALQPEAQDKYEKFMKDLPMSKEYIHFETKISKLLDKARTML